MRFRPTVTFHPIADPTDTSQGMPADHFDLTTAAPLFSIIVPLEFHRGQWERCWLAWQSQSLARCRYEIILAVPPNFPAREKLTTLIQPQDHLEYANASHDIALSAIGARRARGKFLFFTESHCWPEPHILQKCLETFEAHPEWDAFSCCWVRITHNRLSCAEAEMYETDFTAGMLIHPWRKLLDVCFVTRRECYYKCGGFKSEYGHFAEWLLAANYFALGHTIGYVPDAWLKHYYIGGLGELSTFTRDFTTGEMRFFARGSHEPGAHLLTPPPEWICRGNWDRRLAQSLLRIAMRGMCAPSAACLRRARTFARMLIRWLTPAILGEGAARIVSVLNVWWAFAATKLATLIGSKAYLSAAFKSYIAALIHRQRLECLASERCVQPKTPGNLQGDLAAGWNLFAPGNAGFYPIEITQETRFRWSETAAIMRAWMPAGRHRVCIECLPIRSLTDGTELRVFFNERRVCPQDISIGRDSIDIRLNLDQSHHSTLGWTCLPFAAPRDRRSLGLPVKRIVWSAG
jgi:hypothetical protein